MTLSLLVVDDHELIRLGLHAMLEGTPIQVTASASCKAETLEVAHRMKFDLVLLDVRIPHDDGFAILEILKAEAPSLPVLMYSTFEYPNLIARAVALGASGFIPKSVPRDRMIELLIAVGAGKNIWTREELRRASSAVTSSSAGADDLPLTLRESEILKLLASGSTNKRIASQLNISYETVKEHVQNILRKIGVSDRTQAAIWAVRHGLV